MAGRRSPWRDERGQARPTGTRSTSSPFAESSTARSVAAESMTRRSSSTATWSSSPTHRQAPSGSSPPARASRSRTDRSPSGVRRSGRPAEARWSRPPRRPPDLEPSPFRRQESSRRPLRPRFRRICFGSSQTTAHQARSRGSPRRPDPENRRYCDHCRPIRRREVAEVSRRRSKCTEAVQGEDSSSGSTNRNRRLNTGLAPGGPDHNEARLERSEISRAARERSRAASGPHRPDRVRPARARARSPRRPLRPVARPQGAGNRTQAQ